MTSLDARNSDRNSDQKLRRILILKGGKPAVIPMRVPPKLERVINLKTAKALRLEVPPLLLACGANVVEPPLPSASSFWRYLWCILRG